MSGKDHDQLDDAQFAAFLQGDDALARDLAALEQAAQPAANDPVAESATGSGAAPSVPGRHSRWQLPLALAAGVAAISVALPLWQTHDPVTEAMVTAVPAAPAVATPSAEPPTHTGPGRL